MEKFSTVCKNPRPARLVGGATGKGSAEGLRARLARTARRVAADRGRRQKQARPSLLYREPDLVERVVRDYLTGDIDSIIIDDRETYDRIRDMTLRISRATRNKVKLYEGATPIFEHFDAERQLNNVCRRKVWLKSGAYLYFDETEALVAVDVNTGRHKGGQTQGSKRGLSRVCPLFPPGSWPFLGDYHRLGGFGSMPQVPEGHLTLSS